ncbi:hypothetical protein [Rhodococcus sp. B50]|uniref:hypothetical protein n=1 Tax=Rhodococcus sp. B50 TaxID=2682847 RepID=UPI001BD2407C|nr:hypothetical protein [Rhodococcus sp. B50]MBS9373015.1 hypothetical protein [Rhodococcus sp. B50]
MRRPVVPWGGRGTEAATSDKRTSDTERPSEWQHGAHNLRVYAATGAAVLVAVFAATRGVGVWRSDSVGADRFYSILAVLMLLTAAFGAVFWWPPGRRTRVGHVDAAGRGGTEIGGRRIVFGLLLAMVVCGAFLSLGAAVEIVLGNDGLPVVAVALALVAGVCLTFLAEVVLGRIRAGSLVLGPDGIRLRGWFVESYLPWVSVRGLRAVDRGFPEIWIEGHESAAWARRRTSRMFPFERLPQEPRIEVDSRYLAVDPVQLYRFLEFYVEHSRHRRELGTPAAVDRFAAGFPFTADHE